MRLLHKTRPKPTLLGPGDASWQDDSPTTQLFLKINANRAADLVVTSTSSADAANNDAHTQRRKSVNPVLVAAFNTQKKKTTRKLHTTQPSWDDSILVQLNPRDYSQVLTLSVWDKHKRYKNYLGELRLKLSDVFYKADVFTDKTALKWYKLYSNKQYHSFISGSLLVSFELVVKKQRARRRHRKGNLAFPEVSETEDSSAPFPRVPVVVMSETPADGLDANENSRAPDAAALQSKMDALYMPDDLVPSFSAPGIDFSKKRFDSWVKSLIYPDPASGATQPDEQGFYSDSGEASSAILPDVSDIESIDQSRPGTRSRSGSSASLGRNYEGSQNMAKQALKQNPQLLSVMGDDDQPSTSDLSALSSDSAAPEPSGGVGSQPKKKRFSRRKHGDENFKVSNRNVLGVLFLEIVSCSDLPPERNFTRTSFDMDPFVVVTFGKKTFRTSWKRHTLNPIFNERLAFEILSHERTYDIQFSILDKDHFSFHDNIASVSIPMKEIKDAASFTGSSLSTPSSGLLGKVATFDSAQNSPFSSVTNLSEMEEPSSSQNKSILFVEDDHLVESVKKKKFGNRRKALILQTDTSKFRTMTLSLKLTNSKYEGKYDPRLKIRARFEPYESLRKQFWTVLLEQYNMNETEGQYDYIELISLLDALGSHNSDEIVGKFFQYYDKSVWGGDYLTHEQIVERLEDHVISSTGSEDKIFELEKCPICCQKRLSKKQDIDIITHVAMCSSKDWSIVNKILVSSYVTPRQATKRWFSKVLIKLTYGKYQLGSNSANILVQDRQTGVILEEKMGVVVRLGIRLLYKGLDKAHTKRIRVLLKKMSVKQGIKFDSPQLKGDIESFIKFHKLDLSDCMITDPKQFATFNDFFYRKLKPDARPNESPDEKRIVVSPADCRCTTFETVDSATDLWIKGRNFNLSKLFNGNFNNMEDTDIYNPLKCSLGIFRLAPQDYHRFHSPVEGRVGKIKFIDGEYYTVNPMAIRSHLDVFGENIRSIIPIETEDFGTVIMIAVGAMMVGSTVLTVKEGDSLKRGDEVGYFKFGGSTIVLLFEKKHFKFDGDLIENSKMCVETLIRVGQSIGHSPDVDEYTRDHIDFEKQSKDFKLNLIRVLTGGDLDTTELSNWESMNLKITQDDLNELAQDDDGGYDEDEEDGSFDDSFLIESRE